MAGMPAAEIEVDSELVRTLLREQHPDLADLAIRPLDAGWDNAMFRLGGDLLVRLPRRSVAATLLEHEQRWLPQIAPRLPVPVPAPLRTGRPNAHFPWPWSVLPWFEAESADLAPLASGQASSFAAFLKALHVPAPSDAPPNPVRGVPLSARVEAVAERMARLKRSTDAITPAIAQAWEAALAAPVAFEPTWLHGDLHARNVLTSDGRLAAVIDWGDMTSGDVATDLAAIWMLLPDLASRRAAMQAYGGQPADVWARARGWAVLFGVVLLDSGLVDHPRHAAMGALTLARVEEGP
jgi:aminoglycoside phosphotransferase (APT) family kinase protein